MRPEKEWNGGRRKKTPVLAMEIAAGEAEGCAGRGRVRAGAPGSEAAAGRGRGLGSRRSSSRRQRRPVSHCC